MEEETKKVTSFAELAERADDAIAIANEFNVEFGECLKKIKAAYDVEIFETQQALTSALKERNSALKELNGALKESNELLTKLIDAHEAIAGIRGALKDKDLSPSEFRVRVADTLVSYAEKLEAQKAQKAEKGE